jgi:hypothetical protein
MRKKILIINILSYVVMGLIGLFMGIADLYLDNWKFWVILILVIVYGLLSRYLGYTESEDKTK